MIFGNVNGLCGLGDNSTFGVLQCSFMLFEPTDTLSIIILFGVLFNILSLLRVLKCSIFSL